MPIPGSIMGNMIPDMTALTDYLADNHYPSTCDFYSRATSDEDSGQETYSYSLMAADHQDIPCRKSPLIQIRPQDQEVNMDAFQRQVAKFQLNILGHFTDIQNDYKVDIDGTLHRIIAVEDDGNGLTMRFMLSDVEPFGEMATPEEP